MKLTGKCKEDFEKWLFNRNLLSSICIKYEILFFNFYDLTESMQYGVYTDFFVGNLQKSREEAIRLYNKHYNETHIEEK